MQNVDLILTLACVRELLLRWASQHSSKDGELDSDVTPFRIYGAPGVIRTPDLWFVDRGVARKLSQVHGAFSTVASLRSASVSSLSNLPVLHLFWLSR